MLYSHRSHGMRDCNFLRLMYNNATFRPYDYFPNFFINFFEKNGNSKYVQNCLVLSKNHKEFKRLISYVLILH
jgi:hypothetical protein